ncbi:expressed unknown protein [Ectocarpus siliculosus]|uniref:Uncharacterized protein n=1 Tax=Ectocarpus siliculosus TaxID=2880 RepID=D7G4J3_ECTSI|nr:expressed unknown protein [Ectocarpus siliculosus]|eukprot:CBJ48896.1 expressed unknown protein [Ectocarpus siliculosus]
MGAAEAVSCRGLLAKGVWMRLGGRRRGGGGSVSQSRCYSGDEGGRVETRVFQAGRCRW